MPEIDFLNLIFLVVVLLAAFSPIGFVPVKRLFRRYRAHTVPGGSVLLSYYIGGADVMPVRNGKVGKLHYSMLAINSGLLTRGRADKQAMVFRVELPYASRIHLLGIPKRSGAVQIVPTLGKSIMEKVDLEGDFYKYFQLYCQKGMQTETRYVLDPKAMAFAIDFCQSHNWEIVGNELYFLQETGTGSADDRTAMFADIEKFVDEIRPALERPLTTAELMKITPYGEDRRTTLPCPLCSQPMPNKERYFECPNGDGVLLGGKELIKLMEGRIDLNDATGDVPRGHDLKCPGCEHTMQRVAYNGSAMIIDACPQCHYRWLDGSEIAGGQSN